MLETVGQPQDMAQPALSPDGQRIAVRSTESGNTDIWVHDLIRSTRTRLTFEEEVEACPTWSLSGREIAYRKGRSLLHKAADGTGEAVVLMEAEGLLYSPDWSRDGRYLVYFEVDQETGEDIRDVELQADGEAAESIMF
jgi:Tol biopolymer transport system component